MKEDASRYCFNATESVGLETGGRQREQYTLWEESMVVLHEAMAHLSEPLAPAGMPCFEA